MAPERTQPNQPPLMDVDGFTPLANICNETYCCAIEGLPPYSSFNLLAVRCFWPDAQVALLPEGIALVVRDPLDGQPHVTALTDGADPVVLRNLCFQAYAEKLTLRLVPKHTLTPLPFGYEIAPRADGFDYIIDIDAMLDSDNPDVAHNHQRATNYRLSHPDVIISTVPLTDSTIRAILNVDDVWREHHSSTQTIRSDASALRRCLAQRDDFRLTAIAAFDSNGTMVGWTLNERLADGFYMAHFGKTLPGHTGLSEALELDTAAYMRTLECTRMNFQEDHGNRGLRRVKRSWAPAELLEVYDVQCIL